MIIVHIFGRIKALFLAFISVFRRAFCCFSRRRKPSLTGCDVLSSVSVIQNDNSQHARNKDYVIYLLNICSFTRKSIFILFQAERDWNSWDDTPRTVDEHIEQYRQRLAKPKTPPLQGPELDFFQVRFFKNTKCRQFQSSIFLQDMTPKIIRQTKVLIKTENPEPVQTDFSRLQATSAANIPIVQSAELEDWDDDDPQHGWDDASDEATKALIREKRREMRAQRKMEQQQERMKRAQMQNVNHHSSRRH